MKIVSLALNLPGPVAVARLVAGGASAIKIEPPWGDPLAAICKPSYDELHARVTIERLDLKTTAGMAALKVRLGFADVFIAGHRPRALARLGLDADAIAAPVPQPPPLEHRRRQVTPGRSRTRSQLPGTSGVGARRLAADTGGRHGRRRARARCRARADARGAGVATGGRPVRRRERSGGAAQIRPHRSGRPVRRRQSVRTRSMRRRTAWWRSARSSRISARDLYDALELPDGSDLSITMLTRTAAEWEQWAPAETSRCRRQSITLNTETRNMAFECSRILSVFPLFPWLDFFRVSLRGPSSALSSAAEPA